MGLETLAIPMLMKLRKGTVQEKQILALEKVEGHMYRDSTGKQYQVTEIDSEQQTLESQG